MADWTWVRVAIIAALACAAKPAIADPSIVDVSAFLVQLRCADGVLWVARPDCPGARPQRAADPMLMRRHDWPPPDGYMISDAFQADDGRSYITSFVLPPFQAFNARLGDGGEIYVIDGDTVRIAVTCGMPAIWISIGIVM